MIDSHVHLIGTGAGGTGCRLRRRGVQRIMQPFLLREMGLVATDLDGDFDRIYLERLLVLVRDAGISRILLLAQESVYREDGERWEDGEVFYVPNERVLELARIHPEILPAVSIHPARPDALEELDRCLEGGAAAMKCLPNCQNIDPALPRYRRFWERMAEAGLPLLAHTGGERMLPVVRPELADPRILETPLEIGVTCIAAHCGTASGPRLPGGFEGFVSLLRRFPNLYGDISALSFPRKARHVREMLETGVVERLLHGSDYPVPVHPLWMCLAGELRVADYRRLRRIGNPLARDVALKRVLGFPEEVFSRGLGIWRQPECDELVKHVFDT